MSKLEVKTIVTESGLEVTFDPRVSYPLKIDENGGELMLSLEKAYELVDALDDLAHDINKAYEEA